MLLRGGKGHAGVHFVCVMSPQSCALAVLMGGIQTSPFTSQLFSPSLAGNPCGSQITPLSSALSVHLGVTVTSCQLRTVLYSVFPPCS